MQRSKEHIMKFDCSKSDLIHALNIVQRGVARKTTMPILEGILMEATDHKIVLTSTNLEISVKTTLPAHIEQDGAIILGASFFSSLVKKLSGDDIYFESTGQDTLKMTCELSTYTIKGMSPEDFPAFPEIIDDYTFAIKADVLHDLIRGTIFSVALKENIPVLTGLKLEIEGDQITVVALDGYRLALRKGTLSKAIDQPVSVIVPGSSMSELEKMISSTEEDIQVNLSKSQIFFTVGDTEFTSRLLEGEFINYHHIIPEETNTEITVSRRALLDSTERAALLANEGKNNLIKLDIGMEELTLTSNADIGEVHEVIPIKKTGDDLRIAFNSKFIIDALKVISEEDITIRLTNPVGPALIVGDDDRFVTLILPVRVSDDM
jgi:DNA polymerase-3 subunit beta